MQVLVGTQLHVVLGETFAVGKVFLVVLVPVAQVYDLSVVEHRLARRRCVIHFINYFILINCYNLKY